MKLASSPRPSSQQPNVLQLWPHRQPNENPNAPLVALRGDAPVIQDDTFDAKNENIYIYYIYIEIYIHV